MIRVRKLAMITTVNLNRDKHIETLDVTNMHVLGKNKQEEKREKKGSKIAIYSYSIIVVVFKSTVLFSTWCGLFHFSSF